MRQCRKSGISKELFASGLVIDSTLGPIAENELVTPFTSADGRYRLRLRDRFHKLVRPAGVTKPKPKRKSLGVSKARKGYNGPGSQVRRLKAARKESNAPSAPKLVAGKCLTTHSN